MKLPMQPYFMTRILLIIMLIVILVALGQWNVDPAIYSIVTLLFIIFTSFLPPRIPRYQWLVRNYLVQISKVDNYDWILKELESDESVKYQDDDTIIHYVDQALNRIMDSRPTS